MCGKPRPGKPRKAGILQSAQPPLVTFRRIGQAQHGHGRQFPRQGGHRLMGRSRHASRLNGETLRKGKRPEIFTTSNTDPDLSQTSEIKQHYPRQ
jgi:hypothetical protein